MMIYKVQLLSLFSKFFRLIPVAYFLFLFQLFILYCWLLKTIEWQSESFIKFLCQLVLWNTPTAPLQRGMTPLKECPEYDTKQSDGEVLVMLELWGIWSTPSLPSLPGTLSPGVVALDRVLSMDQIELNYVLMLNWIVRNRTVLTLNLCTYAKLNYLK